MNPEHACFYLGFLTCAGIVLVVTALFGWAFIALNEGGDWMRAAGRVIAGWRRR